MNAGTYCAIARDYMKKTGNHFAGKSASEMQAEMETKPPETAAELDRLRQINAELLAALKMLINASYDSVNGKQYAPYRVDEIAIARAAIAKAEGEKS